MIDKPSSANKNHIKNQIEINKNTTQKTEVKLSAKEHLNNIHNDNNNNDINKNFNHLKNNAHKAISETLSKLFGINITKQNAIYSNILDFLNSSLNSSNSSNSSNLSNLSFKSPFNLALYIMNDCKSLPFFSDTLLSKLLSAKIDMNLLKDISHIMNYRTLLLFPEIAPFLPFFLDKTKLSRNKFEGNVHKSIEEFINILENIEDTELRDETLSIIIKLLSTNPNYGKYGKYGSMYFFDDDKLNTMDFYREETNLFISGKFSNLGIIDIIAKFSKDYINANIFIETAEIKNTIYGIKDAIKDSKGKPVKINLYTISEYDNAVLEIKNSCISCLNIDTLV
jgi:hypothetical protein